MQIPTIPSWLITCDFPDELQFAAYIGQREEYRVGNDDQPRTSAETEWRTWWASLPGRTFGVRYASTTEANPTIPLPKLLHQVDPREAGYSPPHFVTLGNTPALQKSAQTYWPDFHRDWSFVDGQKTQLTTNMQSQLTRVRLNKLVRDCAWRSGKLFSRPFRFRLDFVIWPEDYQREVSGSHIVLGRQYLEAAKCDRLRALLKEYILKLV